MPRTLKLSQEEWGLVAELLETERGNLHPEIRHTDSPKVHDDLQKRLETVNGLAERMKSEPAKVVARAKTCGLS